jgi:hypothetical protein
MIVEITKDEIDRAVQKENQDGDTNVSHPNKWQS